MQSLPTVSMFISGVAHPNWGEVTNPYNRALQWCRHPGNKTPMVMLLAASPFAPWRSTMLWSHRRYSSRRDSATCAFLLYANLLGQHCHMAEWVNLYNRSSQDILCKNGVILKPVSIWHSKPKTTLYPRFPFYLLHRFAICRPSYSSHKQWE